MKSTGFSFNVKKPDFDEIFPSDLPAEQVARYLASAKADFFKHAIQDEIVVTADTVVILDNRILNKPADRTEAIEMLSALAGNTHRVMTGVSILTREGQEHFDDTTYVTFEQLTRDAIEYYIDHFRPYDKAGSYGAQDCLPDDMNPCSEEEIRFLKTIGREHLVAETLSETRPENGIVIIREIAGSYFNVMGLPIHKVYERLKTWS